VKLLPDNAVYNEAIKKIQETTVDIDEENDKNNLVCEPTTAAANVCNSDRV
jgi:hypothetical protein